MSYLKKYGVEQLLKKATKQSDLTLTDEEINEIADFILQETRVIANSETYRNNLKKEFYHLNDVDLDGFDILSTIIRIDGMEIIVEWPLSSGDRVPNITIPNNSWFLLIEDPNLSVWLYEQSENNPSQTALTTFLHSNGYEWLRGEGKTRIVSPHNQEDVDYLTRFWKTAKNDIRDEGVSIGDVIEQFIEREKYSNYG